MRVTCLCRMALCCTVFSCALTGSEYLFFIHRAVELCTTAEPSTASRSAHSTTTKPYVFNHTWRDDIIIRVDDSSYSSVSAVVVWYCYLGSSGVLCFCGVFVSAVCTCVLKRSTMHVLLLTHYWMVYARGGWSLHGCFCAIVERVVDMTRAGDDTMCIHTGCKWTIIHSLWRGNGAPRLLLSCVCGVWMLYMALCISACCVVLL